MKCLVRVAQKTVVRGRNRLGIRWQMSIETGNSPEATEG